MDKLRAALAQHGRWAPLVLYADRMEAHREADFSTALENAKALLESIAKEICSARSTPLEANPSINSVLKKAFSALGYSGSQLVTQVSASLANIGQHIGELRNEISPTSHGRPLAELEQRNHKVDLLTRDFLMDSTVVVAVFLIRAFEERQAQVAALPVAPIAEAKQTLQGRATRTTSRSTTSGTSRSASSPWATTPTRPARSCSRWMAKPMPPNARPIET